FFWSNISNDEVKELIHWLSSGEWKSDLLNPLNPKELRVVYDPAKSILEKLLVPHRVERDQIIIEGENAKSIFISLGLQPGQKPDKSLVNSLMKKVDDYCLKLQSDEEKGRSVDLVSILSGIKIRDKAGTWIGSRMGRPEKSRERHMKPAVHSLFPIGNAGGKTRNIIKAYKDAKARKLKYDVTVEIARMRCPFCGGLSFSRKCQRCGKQTKPERICSKCGKPSATEFHICSTVQTKPGKEIKSKTVFYDSRPINIVEIVEDAAAKTKVLPEEVKCVNGLVSELKIPEPLEKGILRAVHDVSVFKDGTCRFDATNVPVTHFYPREIGTPVSKLRELGYLKDAYGNELKSEDQLVELLPHDMIVSERCLKYMARVARFVDDELVKIYGLPPYYNLKEDRDIIGHLVIELSPHTSCGIASRIIGTTKAHVCYAHPYLFAASRRDCLQGNTMMYYKNDEELHASTISEMFIRYSKRPDLPKIIDGKWELIDLTDQNVFALGTDINGNAEEKKIKFIMRKPYSGQLVKIIAQNNQEIIATPDHRVWVFDPKTKQLKEKRVRELSENDLLASLNKVNLENPLINEPNKVNQLDELDLLEFFLEDKESVKMTVRTNKSFAKEVIKRFGKNLKTLGDYLNMSKRQIINSFYRAPYSIPLYSYVKLKQEGENNFWLGFKRNFGKVPLKIKITDKLLRLFGYYISEGWAWRSSKKGKESYHIGIAASDPIIRQDIKNCIIHSLKVPVYEDEKGVYITSKIYYKLFTEKLKFGNNAYTKDIPDWIFNLPEEKIYAFLGGCYQGDGNVYDCEVKYCTVSEKLASKMYFLLTRLGMSPTLKIEKDRPTTSKFLIDRYQKLGREPPKTTLHYVCLYSIDSKKIASKINLIGEKGRKLKVIEKLIKKDKETDKVLNTVRRYIKSEKDIRVLEIKSLEYLDSSCLPEPYVYDIQLESDKDKIFACGKGMLLSHNCDGDENAIMLLMDGLLNFSKHYLPVTRGGQMDAPIVMMTHIDPSEVDDQVHALEVVQGFPSSFYEASWRFAHPSECKIEIVSDRLGKENETYNLWFTHYTPDMNNGALTTQYVYLKSMKDKISAQLGLAKKIAAVDARDAAERLIMSHFLPDLYG
ncbi:MAG: LAGLIDADG family homing endonuclease, partial [Candidatus Micrarchaeia archaeon]